MKDIGDRCVHCGKSTAFGSGRFVNRIPADADDEAEDDNGKIIFVEGWYRKGYACVECMSWDCDRCGELTFEYNFIAAKDNKGNYYSEHVCSDCTTEEEWKELDTL